MNDWKPTSLIHSIWLNKLLRHAYKNLPLPWHFKHRLKDIYLRRPGALNTLTKNFFQLDCNSDALPSVAASAGQYDHARPGILVVVSSVLSFSEDRHAHPMLATLCLLQEMKFHITFVSESRDSLHQETLEEQGVHLLHGFDAIPSHLKAEGGKYHYVLLYGAETAFRHLPYVRAYAPYSRVIYWMANPQTAVRPADPSFPDDNTELRRFELFNTACADLVLAASDEEKNNLLAVQPETKVALLPNLTIYQNSDSRVMKHWVDIFAATGKPIRDRGREDNEAASPTFPRDVRHNSTPLGRAEI